MPRSDISRAPTAHVSATLTVDTPDVTGEVTRGETGRVDAAPSVHGPGDAP